MKEGKQNWIEIYTDFNKLCEAVYSWRYECIICVREKDLNLVPTRPTSEKYDEDTLVWHIEMEHDVPTKQEFIDQSTGTKIKETDQQAVIRFRVKNKRAGNPDTCQCPQCRAKRMLENMDNVAG